MNTFSPPSPEEVRPEPQVVVKQSWLRRHPVWTGLIVGFLTVVVFSAAATTNDTSVGTTDRYVEQTQEGFEPQPADALDTETMDAIFELSADFAIETIGADVYYEAVNTLGMDASRDAFMSGYMETGASYSDGLKVWAIILRKLGL